MSYLSFKTCVTYHGPSTKALFEGLLSQKTHHAQVLQGDYFSISDFGESQNYQDKITHWLNLQLEELVQTWDKSTAERWGIVFASTKGIIEDIVWDQNPPKGDPYESILTRLVNKFPYPVKKSIAISNACSSGHGAIEMAQRWLSRDHVDHVFVFGADLIGPFTMKGFTSLRALSETKKLQPFDKNRDGLILGDGIASVVVSQKLTAQRALKISPVHTLCEGSSATRPDITGKNLAQCFAKASQSVADVVLAHGTGTFYNDLTESNAIYKFFNKQTPPVVTTSKWSVGHTLGVSGLIDLCLAAEILENNVAPAIATLQQSDLEIAEWLLTEHLEKPMNTVLISSLGFGGICSAMEICKVKSL
ncbi:MAG: beta-ketoacyl synthase N-terminal-like domain-containing protein [Pseudomonadota bacterium]